MLDEPSLGLSPMMVDQIYALLSTIRTQGVTILLVEQNARRACSALPNRVYVMSSEKVALCAGDAAEIASHARFDAAYFGVACTCARRQARP